MEQKAAASCPEHTCGATCPVRTQAFALRRRHPTLPHSSLKSSPIPSSSSAFLRSAPCSLSSTFCRKQSLPVSRFLHPDSHCLPRSPPGPLLVALPPLPSPYSFLLHSSDLPSHSLAQILPLAPHCLRNTFHSPAGPGGFSGLRPHVPFMSTHTLVGHSRWTTSCPSAPGTFPPPPGCPPSLAILPGQPRQ